MSDFVEYIPKRHGQKPAYWTPDMPTGLDGKNFVRQPNWAWIAGTTYYVPREAVEGPQIEVVTLDNAAKQPCPNCEAQAAEIKRLHKSASCLAESRQLAVKDVAELETEIERLRGIGLHLVQHINWVTNGLPDLLEDAWLTDEEGVINAAIAAATEARAALEKQP